MTGTCAVDAAAITELIRAACRVVARMEPGQDLLLVGPFLQLTMQHQLKSKLQETFYDSLH